MQDAGNTTTLAHYLELLAGAGMLAGLPKSSGSTVRQRGSMPKLQVPQHGLMTAQAHVGFANARRDPERWGRIVESAIGAHLANAAAAGVCELFYWRVRNHEVDFVARVGKTVTAIEVKSGRPRDVFPGLMAFGTAFPKTRKLLVGADGIPVDGFLAHSTPEAFRFSATDFNSYVAISTAEGAPQRKNGRMAASTAPGLGVKPRMKVLGKPVVTVTKS